MSITLSGAQFAMNAKQLELGGLTEAEVGQVVALLEVLKVKQARNLLRNAYYDSKQVVRMLGVAVPKHLEDIETVLGWPEKAVSDLEERIELEGLVLPGADWAEFGLDVAWEDNRLSLGASMAHTSALKFAVTFVAVTRGQQGEPDVLIRPLSALSTAARWDKHRHWVRDALTVTSTDVAGVVEFILWTADAVLTCARDSRGRWTVDRRQHVQGRPLIVPLPFRPSLERPFGRSRISRPVMAFTDRAVRTLLRSEVTSEIFSAPQRYLLGGDDEAFMDEDGNPTPAWEAIIGRIHAIGRDEDGNLPTVWQAPQTSMQPHIDMLRSDAMQFSGETGVSPTSLGVVHDNPASDAAMKTAYLKLVKTAERASTSFGQGWVDVGNLAVMVRDNLAEPAPELVGMRAKFRRADEPTVGQAADAAMKQVAALPWLAESTVILERMGYSQTEIVRLLADKRRARSSDILSALGVTVDDA